MVYVVIASVMVVLVGITYLYFVFESIGFSTRKRHHQITETEILKEDCLVEEKSFSFKAIISIVGSLVILILLGTSPVFWNLTPFVAIGSAIAVIIAFLWDRKNYGSY